MRSFLKLILSVTLVTGVSVAKDLPDAPNVGTAPAAAPVVEAVVPVPSPAKPERKVVDKKFIALAIVSTGSAFSDSYTTMFATENWLAGKTNVCNIEVQSAYLYGTHPTASRAYAVASAKSVGTLIAAYYLRKHHNRFWSAPLVANGVTSLQGVTQNMRVCN